MLKKSDFNYWKLIEKCDFINFFYYVDFFLWLCFFIVKFEKNPTYDYTQELLNRCFRWGKINFKVWLRNLYNEAFNAHSMCPSKMIDDEYKTGIRVYSAK